LGRRRHSPSSIAEAEDVVATWDRHGSYGGAGWR